MTDKTSILKEAADHFFSLAELFNTLAELQPQTTAAVTPESLAASVSAAAPPADDLPPIPEGKSRDQVFAECPVHFKPWTVKEGGISKAGKPYKAFWKCNGTNPDGTYCNKKPDPSWARAHDPEQALLRGAA